MTIQTDLSVAPYFDDFDETKDFHKILFQPSVSVQVRELNQLQTMLQKQIERFGDNIFKRGTIIDGCNITYLSVFPYIKLKDLSVDGAPVNISAYSGYYVKNQANVTPLVATVVTVVGGYESQAPDLNTLYIKYINSGFYSNGSAEVEETSFSANQTLTVYNPSGVVESVASYNDSSGFANTDSVVFTSALAIQNSTGGTSFANNFYVGDYVSDATANAIILSVDTTTNTEVVLLKVRPRAVDLQTANSALWSFQVNTNIQSTNTAPSDLANIVSLVGAGATGVLKTGSLGEVSTISVTNSGDGYYVAPQVDIASVGATTGQIAAANLVALTHLASITIANNSVDPVGNGYAMSVGPGVIYQKGYFSRVNGQLIVVEKYNSLPDQKVVGFDTVEDIVNSNQDESLLDNATGEPNVTAPGANRLKLTPNLIVLSKSDADANSSFLSVTEFSNGNPYKQNRQTVYNVIEGEMAKRTFEESGDYVIDPFLTTTKSPTSFLDEDEYFSVQIDPGKAYIRGNRVETLLNYTGQIRKGTDTVIANNATISMNYGNYVTVKQVGGTFIFKTGDLVNLYPTAATYVTTNGLAGTTPSAAGLGTTLGTARIRSITHEAGVPGTADAVYRLYLFDIRLATAKNFSLVRSIFYNGTNKGVCDAVLENSKAVLKDNNGTSLLYYAGIPAVKSTNNISYVYRTIANNLTLASNGIITWSVAGGETFPYTGTLSTSQENEIIVVPLANTRMSSNIGGSITCNTSSPQINGTSTSFATELQAGDYIRVANATVNTIAQVNNIVNNTVLFVTSNPVTGVSGNAVVYFPQNIPVPLSQVARTANVNSTGDTFVVSMGGNVNTATTVAVAYNVRSSNTTPITKTVNRDKYVRLSLANNATSNSGPWVLGIPDIFHMKGVYLGANNSYAPGDSGVTEVTNDFFIDHNQTEDYYGISYLYKKPNSTTALTTSNWLLVKFDHFTDSGEGLKAPGASGSYNIDDDIVLSSSTTTINTLEIPEVYGKKGTYYDLRDQFDLRPQSANTVTANTVAANAPINPIEPTNSARFGVGDKKFPAPDSSLSATVEYYQGRSSRVTINEGGDFYVMEGTPGSFSPPAKPVDALTISVLNIPPYPSLPKVLSASEIEFLDTKIANEKYTNKRAVDYRITEPARENNVPSNQPRGYTMADIGAIERRVEGLEYYTAFTLAEALTQKQSIPSSLDSSMERFKFGFFVDNFDNYSYADRNNPGYRANIIDGCLQPYAEEINLPAEIPASPGDVTLPYVEYSYMSQLNATDGPMAIVVANTAVNPEVIVVANTTPTTNTTTGTIILPPYTPTVSVVPQSREVTSRNAQITVYYATQLRTYSDVTPYVYEDFFVTMGDYSGTTTFNFFDIGANFAVEVSKSSVGGNGPWSSFKTTADAVVSGQTRFSTPYVGSSVYRAAQDLPHPGTIERQSYGPAGFFIKDHGTLTWQHSPLSGKYYRIRIYKGAGISLPNRPYEVHAQYDFPSSESDGIIAGAALSNIFSVRYTGTSISTPSTSIYSTSDYPLGYAPNTQVGATGTNILQDQNIKVKLIGLKPSTKHIVTLDAVDVTSLCKQTGSSLGAGLKSKSDGTLEFVLYLDTGSASISDAQKAAYLSLKQSGTKSLVVTSTDGSSKVTTTLSVAGWSAPTRD